MELAKLTQSADGRLQQRADVVQQRSGHAHEDDIQVRRDRVNFVSQSAGRAYLWWRIVEGWPSDFLFTSFPAMPLVVSRSGRWDGKRAERVFDRGEIHVILLPLFFFFVEPPTPPAEELVGHSPMPVTTPLEGRSPLAPPHLSGVGRGGETFRTWSVRRPISSLPARFRLGAPASLRGRDTTLRWHQESPRCLDQEDPGALIDSRWRVRC